MRTGALAYTIKCEEFNLFLRDRLNNLRSGESRRKQFAAHGSWKNLAGLCPAPGSGPLNPWTSPREACLLFVVGLGPRLSLH